MEELKIKELIKEMFKYKILVLLIAIIISVVATTYNLYNVSQNKYGVKAEVAIRYNDIILKDLETIQAQEILTRKVNNTYQYFSTTSIKNKKIKNYKIVATNPSYTDIIIIESKGASEEKLKEIVNNSIEYANAEIKKMYNNNIKDITLLNNIQPQELVEVDNIYIIKKGITYLFIGIIFSIGLFTFKYLLSKN